MKINKGWLIKGFCGEKHPAWKGGITTDRNGYIYIKSYNHPNKDRRGYVSEHRLIVEKNIGRFLNKNEHVHHINGISNDNRIQNLIVMTKIAHHRLHGKQSDVKPMINKCREMIKNGTWYRKSTYPKKCIGCNRILLKQMIGKKGMAGFCSQKCYLKNTSPKTNA